MNRTLPSHFEEDFSTPNRFLEVLTAALSIRTRTIPQTHPHIYRTTYETSQRVAVLFSGGLDCSVLAWLIHTLLPADESIDLINVAFENPRTIITQKIDPKDAYDMCPDRITGRAGWQELRKLSQSTDRIWNFVEVQLDALVLRVDRCAILRDSSQT